MRRFQQYETAQGGRQVLEQHLAESRELLARLSASDLGKLASAILPAMEIGEAGHWSHVLMALIREELGARERGY